MVAPPMRMALAKSLGSHQPAPQATMEVTRAIKAFQDGISMMRCDAIMENYKELEEEGWEKLTWPAPRKLVYKWKVAHAEDEVEEKK